MNKKEYKKPTMRVIELDSADILATSGDPDPQYEEIEINNDTPYRGPWD